MKNCPSSQFLLAGNKQPPRGQLGGIFCQSRQKSLMDSMSRAKRGSFQQAKEKEVCILWSHSSALCTNLLRTALLDSGVALAPRKLPLLYCAPLYFGFMTPHQMLAATSLFSFSHLKCLNYSGPQKFPRIWGQVKALLRTIVLNDVTAAPFSVIFLTCQLQKTHQKQCSCDVIKVVCTQSQWFTQ